MILITGATGNIGKELVKQLADKEYRFVFFAVMRKRQPGWKIELRLPLGI